MATPARAPVAAHTCRPAICSPLALRNPAYGPSSCTITMVTNHIRTAGQTQEKMRKLDRKARLYYPAMGPMAESETRAIWLKALVSQSRELSLCTIHITEQRAAMKPRPTVYVLCGFIGAGKTTFAKKLEQKTGAVRITKDEWLIRLIGNDPTIDGYEDYDSKVVGLTRDFAFYLVGKGIDVILDEGFWFREQRAELRRRIAAMGSREVLYYLDTPIETIRERVAERNLTTRDDSFEIGREMLDSYLKYWQPPGEDEDFVMVSSSDQHTATIPVLDGFPDTHAGLTPNE